jgi:hypothetical protein
MFTAPRGHQHGFSNPSGEQARVLGLWAPSGPALAFMRHIGAALTPDTRQIRITCARSIPGAPAVCCPDTTVPESRFQQPSTDPYAA